MNTNQHESNSGRVRPGGGWRWFFLNLCCLFTALIFASALHGASVSVGNTRGFPGQTATVPFVVRGATNVVAAQFDLAYNTARGTLNPPGLSARYSNHVVRSREISPGVRRVLVYSPNNALLRTNGFSGSFTFNVPVGERVGSGPITPRNVILARTDATAITPATASSGTVFVAPVYRDPANGLVDLFFPSVADQCYLVQATEDFVRWVNISTNVATSEFIDLIDVDGPIYPHRFYRTVLAEAAGEFSPVTLTPDGRVHFQLSGLTGRTYVLQASMNLINWSNTRTNVAAGGSIDFNFPVEARIPYRFFRVKSE